MCGAFDVGGFYLRYPGRNSSAFHVWWCGRQGARRDLLCETFTKGIEQNFAEVGGRLAGTAPEVRAEASLALADTGQCLLSSS